MTPLPFCSVIMPARNGSAMLPITLGALRASDLPPEGWELIVVDDGSTDDTATVAARYADTVVRIPGRNFGPAYARNRGFEVSQGEVVMFIDADVVVRPDTVRRFAEVLAAEPDVGAVFGSYDDTPHEPGFFSQYRNLLHHYVHQKHPGDSETFWAGAGAVRRAVFEEVGMYDEWHYSRPQIEDIEMGGRIRNLGYRILLQPEIQVKHLKRWTFSGVVRTDLADRGIPWTRLLAQRGDSLTTGTLNLKVSEKINTVLAWVGLLSLLSAAVFRSTALLGVGLLCPLIVLLMNLPLLGFFARVRGVFFVARVIPVHLLYYLLNGISFGLGMMIHQLVGAPRPHPTIDAFSEVGVKRWPPVPTRNRSTWTPED